MRAILSCRKIFTGYEWLANKCIVIENGTVQSIIPTGNFSPEQITLSRECVVPAFVDAQVYGASGKLFSEFTNTDTLHSMNDAFRASGTIAFLPTVATNTLDVMKAAMDAVKAYWRNNGEGVLGLHLEGPWINPAKRGAHKSEWIVQPELSAVQELIAYAEGVVKMITIAPEMCSQDVIDFLLSKNIVLSAGHSDAQFSQAMDAFEKGFSTITHLYNAMSPLTHRAPGLVGAAFEHSVVRASIIPDGHHVDFAAISIAKKIMKERLFAITDAVTDTSTGPYRHERSDGKFECNGVLSGSAISMRDAFVNLVKKAGIEAGEAHRMCSLYPAEVLGCDQTIGKIAPGAQGQLAVLNSALEFEELLCP